MGEVHISYITSYDPGHSFLAPFNLHRQVLGVLGLSTLNSISGLHDLEHSPGALRQLHPSAIVHRVFAFDTGASSRPETVDLSSLKNPLEAIEKAGLEDESASPSSGFAGRNASGLVVFPSVRKDLKDVKFYLKTLLPNLIGGILDGLDTIVKGLQGKPLETPRETLDDSMSTSSANPTSPVSSNFIATAAASSAVGTAASRASALFSSFSAEEKKSSRKASQNLASIGPMGAGRYAKVKADYYLLSGDLWNALHTYDSCTNLLGRERAIAGGQDAVWYASALEGWAVTRFLVMRMGGAVEGMASCLKLPQGGVKEKEKKEDKDKEKVLFQFHDKPWSDIAEAYSLALAMYTKCLAPPSFLLESWKSITPDTPRDYTHPLIHSSACLAYSRLLLAIWASGGWNGETCDQLLYGGTPPALAETTRPTQAVYTQHCTASGVQRGDIAAPASLSMTNSSTNGLKLLDQMHLLSSLASIFGAVGFVRKEAYSIRRLQALVVSLIVSGIQLQKKEPSIESQVIRTSGDEESQVFGTMTTTMFSVGAGQNSDSILVLALQVCQTYGIDIEKMPITGLDTGHILSRASIDVKSGKRLSSPLLHRGRASWGLEMSKVETEDWQKYIMEQQAEVAGVRQAPHFGWTQQQILILKDTLEICEVLQDDSSLLFFAAILLRDFWPFLSTEDQVKLKEGIHKVQNSLVAKGQDTLLEYWGPTLILDDLQIVSQAPDVEQTSVKDASDESRASLQFTEKKKASRRSGQTQAAPSVFIDGQSASFIVTLFNPMSISLEVEMIRLDVIKASSIGPRFEADEVNVIIIPPSSYQTVLLTGTPHGEGKLLLRGVQIKLKSCMEKSFALERTDGEHVKVLAKLQSDIDDRWTRTKELGLEARSGLRLPPAKPKGRIEERHVPLQVIAEVPLLLLQSTASIRNGNVALLEGQEREIHLVLVNKSRLPADYISFDFEDDLKTDMLDLLAEGNLDPVHVHELEEDLLHRPFITPLFKLDKDAMVPAGEKKTFSFRIRGKIDVRRACIKIQYGNVQSAKELGRDQFWTRKAELRFDVRVQPVIAIDGLEVGAVEHEGGDDDKILLGMRVHNLHSSSVTIDWKFSDAESSIQAQLAAHTTSHIYVIMKKLSLSRDYLSQAIPNLIPRQFILSKIKQTAEQDRFIKRQFWIRSALIDSIQTRKWTDDKTGQSGDINISGLQCDNEHLLSTLLASKVRISTQFNVDNPVKHEFISLKATIKNTSIDEETLHATYRLIPDVNERLINHIQCTSGHLQGSISNNHKGLKAGESSEIETGLCFLASGTFNFTLQIVQQQVVIAEKKVQIIVS
jgi:hypothetical protein